MNFIIPDWKCVPSNVGALSTLRQGGASGPPYDDGLGKGGLNLGTHVGDHYELVLKNRALLRTHLPSEPAWLNQVHGTTVVNAGKISGVPQADASIATQPGVVCVIQTADCLPVLFCDRGGKVVGAAHAGWRGLVDGVLENTVAEMRAAGGHEILAWLGPAIGPEKFEVGEDVFDVFVGKNRQAAAAFTRISDRSGKYLADIYRLATLTLNTVDVRQICGGGFCTVSDPKKFYSYRRDKSTGRMASLIWLK